MDNDYCEFYHMPCDEVEEQIIIINEEDEVEFDGVCDLNCDNCTWKE